jgi:hypothetical protein
MGIRSDLISPAVTVFLRRGDLGGSLWSDRQMRCCYPKRQAQVSGDVPAYW